MNPLFLKNTQVHKYLQRIIAICIIGAMSFFQFQTNQPLLKISHTQAASEQVGTWAGELEFNGNGFTYTPENGTDRIVVVMVTAESNGLLSNMGSVILGGQTLTSIESNDGVAVGSSLSFHNIIWMGYITESQITSMSGNTLSISWDTAPNVPFGDVKVQAATFQNIDQTTPIIDSASDTDTNGSSIQAGNLTVNDGDLVIYGTVLGSVANHSAPGGYTEQIEQDGSGSDHSAASAVRNSTIAGTENPTATWSSSQRLAMISAVLQESTPTVVGWYDNCFLYREKITIDNTLVGGTSPLIDFPALISKSDTLLRDNANGGRVDQPDGGDFLFTLDDGTTQIDHEIESYVPTTGALNIWVEIPSLPHDTDTELYMYYGCDDGVNQWDIEGTWNSNFEAVHHLQETSGTHFDSTVNNKDSSIVSATQQGTASGIANGTNEFNGSTNRVSFGEPLPTNAFTIELWFNADTIGSNVTALYDQSFSQSSPNNDIYFFLGATNNNIQWQFEGINDADVQITHSTTVNTGQWFYVTGTGIFNGTPQRLYVNGTQVATSATNPGSKPNNPPNPSIGFPIFTSYGIAPQAAIDGRIDEVRISNVERSAGYIETVYNNLSDLNNFLTFDPAESLNPPSDDDVVIDTLEIVYENSNPKIRIDYTLDTLLALTINFITNSNQVQYSTSPSGPWTDATIYGTLSGIDSLLGGGVHNENFEPLYWDASGVADGDYFVRIRPHTGLLFFDEYATSPISISIVRPDTTTIMRNSKFFDEENLFFFGN